MADYISKFPGFKPNPSAPAKDEFARLARQMNWSPGSKGYRQQWINFIGAEFGSHYGTQPTKLANWQALCHEVDITEDISSITKCRTALSKVHVNLVDLVDARRTDVPAKQFSSVKALRNYTKKNGKIFPKRAAKADGFLKALLRHIF